jgi:hypothetical protein
MNDLHCRRIDALRAGSPTTGARRALDPPVGRSPIPVRAGAASASSARGPADPRTGRCACWPLMLLPQAATFAAERSRERRGRPRAGALTPRPRRRPAPARGALAAHGRAFLMRACAPASLELDRTWCRAARVASSPTRSPPCARPAGSRTRWSRGWPRSRSRPHRTAALRPDAGALPRAGASPPSRLHRRHRRQRGAPAPRDERHDRSTRVPRSCSTSAASSRLPLRHHARPAPGRPRRPASRRAYVVLAAHDRGARRGGARVPARRRPRGPDVIAAAGHGERFLHRTGTASASRSEPRTSAPATRSR